MAVGAQGTRSPALAPAVAALGESLHLILGSGALLKGKPGIVRIAVGPVDRVGGAAGDCLRESVSVR